MISDPILRTAMFVAVLLLVSSGIVAVLRARKGGGYRELNDRIKAWWIMAALFFGAVMLPDSMAVACFGFLSFWAMKEFITLLKTRPADHGGLVLTFLSIPVQFYWIATGWYGMFVIFIPVYVFLFLPMRLVLAGDTSGFIASVSQVQWGLLAFVFGLSHLAYLAVMPARGDANGRTLLLFLVLVVELSDVLQYVWGKTLGRRKIIPAVSPNKTWEGFIGGIITASLLGMSLRYLTMFSAVEAFGVSLLITIIGFFGGAVMSAVKRDFGVKDFGALIPGHGGVLDRVDSLCYAAPIFFHYVRYFYY